MKMLKSSLFILAVLVASVAAINPSFAKKSAKSLATAFVQYDCANGSEQEPVVLRDQEGDLILLSQSQAEQICPDENTVICAAEYEITAGATQQPLKLIGGKLVFNPDYPGGATAAEQHRVLSVLFCPAN